MFGFVGVCFANPTAWLGGSLVVAVDYILMIKSFKKIGMDTESDWQTKKARYTGFQRVDKVSTRWQSAKKEVIFWQFEIVGVRLYGRVQIVKKQAMERNFRQISLHLNINI